VGNLRCRNDVAELHLLSECGFMRLTQRSKYLSSRLLHCWRRQRTIALHLGNPLGEAFYQIPTKTLVTTAELTLSSYILSQFTTLVSHLFRLHFLECLREHCKSLRVLGRYRQSIERQESARFTTVEQNRKSSLSFGYLIVEGLIDVGVHRP
jgi:hypothetical protein